MSDLLTGALELLKSNGGQGAVVVAIILTVRELRRARRDILSEWRGLRGDVRAIMRRLGLDVAE